MWREFRCVMDTAFIIGNGESRKIFNLDLLKGKGTIYGCNAIYRDHADLCDKIFCVAPEMQHELKIWYSAANDHKPNLEIVGPESLPRWNFVLDGDKESHVPAGLKIYRKWAGGDLKKNRYKIRDFSEAKGSGCSAVLSAAESGFSNILIIGFDLLGARQWELPEGESSREQNNIYKNTNNYPSRHSMKAYLKYEWLFHLTQTFRKFPNTNFYYINRKEYLDSNHFLKLYFRYAPGNIKTGIYADLIRWINDEREKINWRSFS